MITKEELYKKYSPEYLNEHCLSFNDGWNQLIDEALGYIKNYCEMNDNDNEKDGKSPRLIITYCKEKFSTLRIHYTWEMHGKEWRENDNWTANKYTNVLDFQEYRSRFICEETGLPGTLCCSGGKKRGWMKTLSAEKAKEMGYKIYEECV